MDLFDVVRSCIRRWYVVLPLLLITAWLSYATYTSAKPLYYSNAMISLAPPNTRQGWVVPGAEVPRNGLLAGGEETSVANMVALRLRDPAVVARVVAAGGEPNYNSRVLPGPAALSIGVVPGNLGQLPLLLIEAAEPDPDAAQKTVGLVVAQVDSTLHTMQEQAGVPDDQMVKPFVVFPPGDLFAHQLVSAPGAIWPGRARSMLSDFVPGAGLAVLAGLAIDVLLTRWKARRQQHRQTKVETADGAEYRTRGEEDPPVGQAWRRRRRRDAQPITTRPAATAAAPQNRPPGGNFVELMQPRKRTPWLLAFLCLLIPILPGYLVPAGPLKSNGSPLKLIAIMLFTLAVLGFVLIQRTARTRTVRPGVVLILVYFLVELALCGVGLTHAGSEVVEAGKTRAIIMLAANVGVALYAMTRVETTRQRSILLGCLAIGFTFNCVVGLLQNSTHIDLHLLFQPPGFVDNEVDLGRGTLADVIERFGTRRAFGTSGHPIEFSVVAAVTVPLTIHFARYAANRQVRLLAALAIGVALLAIPAAVSRSGVIALAAALLVYMWTFKARQLGGAVVAGAIAVLFEFLAFPRSAQALWKTINNSAEDTSVLERVADYARVSQTFHDHPVFGLGPGASIPSEYGYLDNQWLQEIVQGGSVGLAAMTVLASAGIFGIAAALRDATTPRERDQAYTMGAMLIGILASSYTFDLFTFTQVTMLFFILFGLLWSNFTISTHARTTRAVEDRASFASYRASHGHYSTDADSFSRGRTVERGWLSSWRRLHLRQWFSGSAQ